MGSSTPDNPALIQGLEADHRRIDALLDTIEALSATGRPQDAAAAVEELDIVLSRHLYAENEVLVPELDLISESVEAEAVILMLQEHERIQSQLLGLRHSAARDPSGEELTEAVQRLRHTLSEHTRIEEQEVYPLLAASGAHERAATVREGGEDEDIFGDSLIP